MSKITSQTTLHIADLAQIPISADQAQKLATAFEETLSVVKKLTEIDTSAVKPTHQVTNLQNVWREDLVEETTMFSQAEALANATRQYQGYFVVPQVITKK